MTYNEVHVFSSKDYPSNAIAPMVRPVVEDLYIWFSNTDAYVFASKGWTLWAPGKTIAETRAL